MSNVGKILSPTPEAWATGQHQQPSGVRSVNHAHLEKEMNKARSALAKHDAHTPEDTAGRAAKLTRAIAAHQALINAQHHIASHGWSPGHKIFGFTRKDHLGHVIKGGRKRRTRRHSQKKRHTRRHKRKRRRRKHRHTYQCRRHTCQCRRHTRRRRRRRRR